MNSMFLAELKQLVLRKIWVKLNLFLRCKVSWLYVSILSNVKIVVRYLVDCGDDLCSLEKLLELFDAKVTNANGTNLATDELFHSLDTNIYNPCFR